MSLLSISLAIFDTAVGNTVAYTYPEVVRSPTEGAVTPEDYLQGWTPICLKKGLQDFCFPDGAHDTTSDTTPVSIRVKRVDAETGETEYKLAFGYAIYHLKPDASVDRGARQRGVLFVTERPMFEVLSAVAKRLVLPLLDIDLRQHALLDGDGAGVAPLINRDAESLVLQGFCRKIFDVVTHALQAPTTIDVSVEATAAATVDPSPGRTAAERSGPWACVRYDLNVPEPASTFLNRLGVDESVAPFDRMHFVAEVNRVLPRSTVCYGPLPDAPDREALTHGVSLCRFVSTSLRGNAETLAYLHHCLLTRVPIIVIGLTGASVAEAVLALMHLCRCLPIHASRFVPYAPIELVDALVATVSATTFAAVGATNAFVAHKPTLGVVKLRLEDGSVEFPPSSVGADPSSAPPLPKHYTKTWRALTKDAAGAELRLRARVAAYNRNVIKEFSVSEGLMYQHLCRRTNVIDAPLSTFATHEPLPPGVTPPLRSPAQGAASPTTVAEVGREASDGFLLVNESSDAAADAPSVGRGGGGKRDPDADDLQSPRLQLVLSPRFGFQSPMANPAKEPDSSSDAASATTSKAVVATQNNPHQTSNNDPYQGLTTVCDEFETAAAHVATAMQRLRAYHACVLSVLQRVAKDSDTKQQLGLDALIGTFDNACGAAGSSTGGNVSDGDLGRLATDSALIAALREQQVREGAHVAHLAILLQQRAVDAVELLSRFNTAGVRRGDNQRMSDFFAAIPGCAAYDFGTQVLFLSGQCNLRMVVSFDGNRTKKIIESFGQLHVFKNYLAFEASALPLAEKCHQVFPFDHIVTLERSKSQTMLFGNNPSTALHLNVYMKHRDYADWRASVSLGLNATTGFFEMIQLLFLRQQRLGVHFSGPTPTPASSPSRGHVDPAVDVDVPAVPEEVPLEKSAATFGRGSQRFSSNTVPIPAPPLTCPVTVPTALYPSSRVVIADEVYENERRYPFIGWSGKLLPTDPANFSDRSGSHKRSKEQWLLCPGFVWTTEWSLAAFDGPVMALTLEEALAGSAVDPAADPWSYGIMWNTLTHGEAGGTVRRRRWVRWRRLAQSLISAVEATNANEDTERPLEAPVAASVPTAPRAAAGDSIRRLDESFVHQFCFNAGDGDEADGHHVDTVLSPARAVPRRTTERSSGASNTAIPTSRFH